MCIRCRYALRLVRAVNRCGEFNVFVGREMGRHLLEKYFNLRSKFLLFIYVTIVYYQFIQTYFFLLSWSIYYTRMFFNTWLQVQVRGTYCPTLVSRILEILKIQTFLPAVRKPTQTSFQGLFKQLLNLCSRTPDILSR